MMMAEKSDMFRNRLTKVFRHVSKLARRQDISCYRVYDHDLPEFPFRIELYEEWLYVAEYRRNHHFMEDEHDAWLAACMQIVSEITAVSMDKIFLRTRERKWGRQGQYQKLDDEKQFITVNESGLRFRINLTDYLDTGLFLDHRITRNLVMEEALNKQVLNLFCYTGSFSVYAAAGGAARIVSVDLSNTYLKWAEENMELNGLLDRNIHLFENEDVKQYLGRLPEDHFDLVVMDPPTFSNSKRMKDFLDVQRDHVSLINQALKAMKKGGVLYFSTNYSRFLLGAHDILADSIKDITKATTPFDFQGRLNRFCFRILR